MLFNPMLQENSELNFFWQIAIFPVLVYQAQNTLHDPCSMVLLQIESDEHSCILLVSWSLKSVSISSIKWQLWFLWIVIQQSLHASISHSRQNSETCSDGWNEHTIAAFSNIERSWFWVIFWRLWAWVQNVHKPALQSLQ